MSGQHGRVFVGADLDVFAGEQRLQLLLQRRDRLLDDQVVLRAARLPQTIRLIVPGRLAVDQDLARCDDGRIGDSRIGDGDAGDVELGRSERSNGPR